MTYQTNHVPKLALRPVKRVPEPFPKPKLRGQTTSWLKREYIEVIRWPKL